MKCICEEISLNEIAENVYLSNLKSHVTSRYMVRRHGEKLHVRTLLSNREPFELTKKNSDYQFRIMYEYFLYAFMLSYDLNENKVTYQGSAVTNGLSEQDLNRLLSVFDIIIIDKLENGMLCITVNLKPYRSKLIYQKCIEWYQTGRFSSIITSIIGQTKGNLKKSELIYYTIRNVVPALVEELKADEFELIQFLKLQIKVCGYVFLPFPGLTMEEILSNEILSKLSIAGELGVVISRSKIPCSQYLFLR